MKKLKLTLLLIIFLPKLSFSEMLSIKCYDIKNEEESFILESKKIDTELNEIYLEDYDINTYYGEIDIEKYIEIFRDCNSEYNVFSFRTIETIGGSPYINKNKVRRKIRNFKESEKPNKFPQLFYDGFFSNEVYLLSIRSETRPNLMPGEVNGFLYSKKFKKQDKKSYLSCFNKLNNKKIETFLVIYGDRVNDSGERLIGDSIEKETSIRSGLKDYKYYYSICKSKGEGYSPVASSSLFSDDIKYFSLRGIIINFMN